MAVRTTSAAVIEIIETDVDISLTPFIEAANALVTELCGDVAAYDDTRLELIERWLSAHFYTVRDPRTTTESVRNVAETFQHREDLGFDTSHYGQMAMRLDTNGGLAALNLRIKKGGGKVSVDYLGTENPDTVDAE